MKTKSTKPAKPKFLNSGCTLLNLALSGTVNGGFPMGRYHLFVGDSSSGKTFICLTSLAEACNTPAFDKHRIIFDNAEDGALMSKRVYFGKKAAARMEEPSPKGASFTIEDFYDNLQAAVDDGRPFIYILDSIDVLSSTAELKKAKKQRVARQNNSKEAGSYGDGKAKVNSTELRKFIRPLADTNSLLIIINQTRDNIGFGFETRTRSGGRALKFYASLEIWSQVYKELTKKIKEKNRQVGIISRCKVKKNRVNGKNRTIDIHFYHSYGIDDIQTNISYLIEENHWKVSKGIISAPEFDFKGKPKDLIHKIEEESLEEELKHIVSGVWEDIEESMVIDRKKRYE